MPGPEGQRKPRLVFFRTLTDGLPDFIALHLTEQVRCLEQFFEVTVVGGDCDYGQVCERYQPDLVLFEGGVYTGRRRITNTTAHPGVPKLGFVHCDAYCPTRISAIADLVGWGVENFVTISVSMAEYTPELAANMFVWPNFVDTQLYRDYGRPTTTPLLLTGSRAAHYPWRNRISTLVAQAYPTTSTSHGGWFTQSATAGMVYGQRYAEMINEASIVPTCGTIARDVVRKHFEIPGARSCLLTERTASVEAAGFVDLRNCVFADDTDVLDKLAELFQDPDRLAAITDAGYELVRARHTAAQRDELRQWLRLWTARRPGQRIVQPAPFQPLELTADPAVVTRPVISHGLDRELLRLGEAAAGAGDDDRAAELFQDCLDYHPMPEPEVALARVELRRGQSERAVRRLVRTTETTLLVDFATAPDPVEWAILIRATACAGRLGEARRMAREYPELRHPELDRTRAALMVLAGLQLGLPADPAARPGPPERRPSVHVLPQRDFTAWAAEFADALAAGGQRRAAGRLRSAIAAAGDLAGDAVVAPLVEPARPLDQTLVAARVIRRKAQRRLRSELRRRFPAKATAQRTTGGT